MMEVYRHTDGNDLVRVATFEYSDGSYILDQRVIWRTEKGELVTSRGPVCDCGIKHQNSCKMTDLFVFDYDELQKEIIEETNVIYRPSVTTREDALDALGNLVKEKL